LALYEGNSAGKSLEIGAVFKAFLLSYIWTLLWQLPLGGIAYKFDGGIIPQRSFL